MRLSHRSHLVASSRFSLLSAAAGAALPLLAIVACSDGAEADGVPVFGNDPGRTSTGGTSADGTDSTTNPNQGTSTSGAAGTGANSESMEVGGNPSTNSGDNDNSGSTNPGAGGTSSDGTGGTASVGGSTGMGGSMAMGGSAPLGMGGNDMQGQAGTGQQAGCDGLYVCDDFEGVAPGSSPDPALWSIVDSFNYSATQSASVQVSTAQAYTGNQSVRVEGNNSLNGFIASVPTDSVYVRAFMRLDSVTPGPVVMSAGVDHNVEVRFRMQGQTPDNPPRSFATINLFGGGGDQVYPDANSGDCPECVPLQATEWLCVEMFVDQPTQTVRLWIDGDQATDEVSPAGWPALPNPINVRLGVWALQGVSTGVFIDDVAIGPNRIGCQ